MICRNIKHYFLCFKKIPDPAQACFKTLTNTSLVMVRYPIFHYQYNPHRLAHHREYELNTTVNSRLNLICFLNIVKYFLKPFVIQKRVTLYNSCLLIHLHPRSSNI